MIVEVTRPTNTLDKYGQRTYNYSAIGEIDISIYLSSNIEINNPKYKNITYVGIALGENKLQEKDKLDNKYIVEEVIPANRWTRVLLSEV